MTKRFHPTAIIGLAAAGALLLAGCRPVVSSPPPSQAPAVHTQSPPAQASAVVTRSAVPATPSVPASSASTSSVTPSAPTPTVAPTSAVAVEPGELRGLQVKVWHAWTGDAGAAIQTLLDEFNAQNEWGIVAIAAPQPGFDALADAVGQAQASGGLTGLVIGYTYQGLAWESQGRAATAGSAPGASATLLADLEPYLQDPVWGLAPEEQADFLPVFWQQDIQSGRRLGLPALRSAQLLYYNQSWAEQLGFSAPPQTPDEFKQQACAAAQANAGDENPQNDLTGGWIISTHYSAISGWLQAFRANYLRPDGEGYRFNTSQVRETFTFLRGLYEQGCAWLSESETPETEFAERKGLFAAGSVSALKRQAQTFELDGRLDRWMAIPFPSPAGQPAISAYGPSFQIFQAAPRDELAAWLLLRWMASPGNQARLAQATGFMPTRSSAVEALLGQADLLPQYRQALELLPYAYAEPTYASWEQVRWAISDAATQLYRYYFEMDQLPALIKLLDQTAAELHTGK